jgi:hypothetical protein
MRLVNSENRAAAEETAVKNIVAYLRKNDYRPFILSFTDLTYPEGTIFRDAYMISMISGKICEQDPLIEKVAVGINATDLEDTSLADIRIKSAEIFNTFTNAEKIYPAIHLSKLEVRDALPLTLRELAWSCRTPICVNGTPMKCNKCSSCRQLSVIMPNGTIPKHPRELKSPSR